MFRIALKLLGFFLQFSVLVLASDLDDIPLIENTNACINGQPQVINDAFGFIISPKFDAFHFLPGNLDCSWIIKAPEGKVVNLRFLKVLMYGCSEGSLEIYDGTSETGTHLGTICSRIGGRTRFRSRGNSLFLKLKSVAEPKAQGYQAYFDHSLPAASCNETEKLCYNEENCFGEAEKCNRIFDCSDGSDEENCEYDIPHFECGVPDIQPDFSNDRIVGGRAAIPNSWPWVASMRLIQREPLGHQCGATLIHPLWLVTAAHCFREVDDIRYWTVHLGKHRKLVRDDTEQLRYISSAIIHPDYKGLKYNSSLSWLQQKENDIALIKLNAPVELNRFVRTACLPSEGRYIGPATLAFTLGWGSTEGTGNELYLKQAMVPLVPRTICQIVYPYYKIGDKMICAGYIKGGHDSCYGDSGGPLLQKEHDGKWTLIGLISTGTICGGKKEPGIYTEVSKYIHWINDTITEN